MNVLTLTKYKSAFPLFLRSLALIGIVTSDLYIPALPNIASFFNVSADYVEFSISIYILGLSLGLIIFGQLSNCYNRKPVLYSALFFYLLGTIICLLSFNIYWLWLGRLLQAFGASAAMISWQTIATDVYQESSKDKMPQIYALMAISPALAPVLGGFLTTNFGFQSNFIVMLISGLILFLTVHFSLPETKEGKNQKLCIHTIIANYKTVLGDKIFLILLAFPCLGACQFYCFAVASPFLFHNLGYTSSQMGLFYLPGPFIYLLTTKTVKGLFANNRFSLMGMLKLSIAINLAGLILYLVFVSLSITSFWQIMIPNMLFSAASGVYMPFIQFKCVTHHKEHAGLAASIIGTCSMLLSFIFSLLLTLISDNILNGYTVTLSIIILLTILLMFLLIKLTAKFN